MTTNTNLKIIMKNSKQNFPTPRLTMLVVALSCGLSTQIWAQQETHLSPVNVIGERIPAFGAALSKENLADRGFATNDTATMLSRVPGLSFYTGGGVSSLPVINGLADDRLKILVDGMSITSACPNHMNPALSYVDPSALSQLNVYAGVVPVSQGGDSIGGSIVVKSTPPAFAQTNPGFQTSGKVSAFYRSNGDVSGASLVANAASDKFSIGYAGNTVDAGNYKDGNGHEVVASRYKVRNSTLNLATQSDSHLVTLAIGWQDIPFQGYPNQSMDMTSNQSLSVNLGYSGTFDWGQLEARAFRQRVQHKMDVLQDKATAAGFPTAASYMPMDTDAVDLGYSIVGTVQLNPKQTARFGHEFHRYTLDDWWPPLVGSMMMEPNTFWNINGGNRDRLALFSELDSQLSEKLSTQVGVRVEQVTMNTGNVQGYYDATVMDAYESDAAAFNARDHKRQDLNWDLTASLRFDASAESTYDLGFSRKTRSPNIHERFTWSSEAMMAGLMNNWFGDLNSYVGNLDLKPEVAYSFKTSANWHDAERRNWELTVAPFYTYVNGYINAVPNTSLNMFNMSMIAGRQSLTFANEDAQLYGIDISGKKYLGKANGDWTLGATLSYTRGKTVNGDNLYNIMPLNARVIIDHELGAWANSFEAVFVSAKDSVSAVRAEQQTPAYTLANYRSAYKFGKGIQFDVGVENLFDTQYILPLGGLEYVSGNMSTAPQPLRAAGRSISVGLTASF